MLNHKLWLVLQVDLPMCWNTRRTSGGWVGFLLAQTTQNRLIWMNEVMKMVVDGTSLLLTSNRTTIFYLDSCVMREMNDCDCGAKQALVQMTRWNPALLHLFFFFFFFLHLTEDMLAVSAITFGEELHLVKCAKLIEMSMALAELTASPNQSK